MKWFEDKESLDLRAIWLSETDPLCMPRMTISKFREEKLPALSWRRWAKENSFENSLSNIDQKPGREGGWARRWAGVSPGCLWWRLGCCNWKGETRIRSRNLIVNQGSSLVNQSQNIAHSLLPAIVGIYLTTNSLFFPHGLNSASQNAHVEVPQNVWQFCKCN